MGNAAIRPDRTMPAAPGAGAFFGAHAGTSRRAMQKAMMQFRNIMSGRSMALLRCSLALSGMSLHDG
jgi:hypothetical protein